MTRDDFRIVPKFYATSSLTMILHQETIIESVEIFKNYSTFEDEADKASRLADIEKQLAAGKKPKSIKTKPIQMKCTKDKRTPQEISAECEKLIKAYIQKNT